MPLSPAGPREAIHTRSIECQGYLRRDGLWDIEGHLCDTKTYGFDNNERGRVEAGDAIHDMWLRLTVDDTLTIRAVEAVTDQGPFAICGEVTANYQRLVGLTIGAGWRRRVHAALGGIEGCTHLVELLGPLGTTAFQTIFPYRNRNRPPRRAAGDGPPQLLNSCYAFRSDGPVVERLWPEFHTGA